MFRGICTLTLFAEDLAAAEAWYTGLLGREPYFRKELGGATAYLEWRLGDRETELGLLDARYAPTGRTPASGIVAYWAVDDVQVAYDDLLARGATSLEGPREQGPGFVTAAVADPFGNVVGVMKNVHYESQA
jgi:predicted enzyme related to lactoylglutathione lyase